MILMSHYRVIGDVVTIHWGETEGKYRNVRFLLSAPKHSHRVGSGSRLRVGGPNENLCPGLSLGLRFNGELVKDSSPSPTDQVHGLEMRNRWELEVVQG
jgi:hypothetical protein